MRGDSSRKILVVTRVLNCYRIHMIKKIIYWVDGTFFGGRLRNYRKGFADGHFFADIEHGFDGKIVINYRKSHSNELAALCDKYGSDKGSNLDVGHPYPWAPHAYVDLYTLMFQGIRNDVRAVFECGLGSSSQIFPANMGPDGRPGASLRVWRDYFPHAQVYGVDIDRGILFEDERIKTCYVDQTNRHSIKNMLKKFGDVCFDVVIDDGLHTFEAGVVLFESIWSSVAMGGIYIIEDVGRNDFLKFKKYFKATSHNASFVTLKRRDERFGDNNLIFIKNTP
jgi:hypothetical protein